MKNSIFTPDLFRSHEVSIGICFVVGMLYCVGLTLGNFIFQNILSVIFIAFLGVLFFKNLQQINQFQEKHPVFVYMQLIALNLSIALTAAAIHSPNSFFWVEDAVSTHLPASEAYANFFSGHSNWQSLAPFRDVAGITTHVLTGFFIAILGKNILATILTQLLFKALIVFFIYKISTILWNKKTAFIATQLYGFCPTIFFYNLVLYKEGAVQFFLAIIVFLVLKIFLHNKYYNLIPLVFFLYLLEKERFYITYLLLLMLPFFIYTLPFKKTGKNISILLLLAIALTLGAYLEFPDFFSITKLVYKVNRLRNTWAGYSDVLNQYNYDIPYPLAFIKILFSPYFTFNKFKIFSDFSLLLIWGSPINQIIILSALLGFFQNIKKSMLHFNLWLPFIIFLVFAAYISPWSGRLRDSFYPLIACYAAHYLLSNKYFQKLFRLKNETTK